MFLLKIQNTLVLKICDNRMQVTGIFPTPIYGAVDIKQITELELDFVEKQKSKIRKNDGNTATLDTYVLEQVVFKDLKNILEQHLEEYLKEVICPLEENIKIYITQSWLNYTTFHQHHHVHSHGNSLLSGVFYFKADKKFDHIFFRRSSQPSLLSITSKEPNIYNIMDCKISVDKAMLLIFPSSLLHYVGTKEDDNERVSLSFNTFVKGNIGHPRSLTQLNL